MRKIQKPLPMPNLEAIYQSLILDDDYIRPGDIFCEILTGERVCVQLGDAVRIVYDGKKKLIWINGKRAVKA